MADGFDFDYAEMDRLFADLAEAPKRAAKEIPKALEVTARHVKDGWRDKVRGSEDLQHLESALSYNIDKASVFGTAVFTAEIGFDKGRTQGPLGNISEFGAVSEFGSVMHPPRGYGLAALLENQADFEKGLGMAIGDIL